MDEYGHFHAQNLFQVTKYGTSSVLRKVFSCAELFSKVCRSTGCLKAEENLKNTKFLIFQAIFIASKVTSEY